jgi:diketogulonate reductase-like aldo/keto reductase
MQRGWHCADRDGSHGSTLEDPVIGKIAKAHRKSAVQVMLRWHLQEGRSVMPKSTKPHRITENFDVFDFELSADETAAIDGLDTAQRGGPEPADITLEAFGRPIPEA